MSSQPSTANYQPLYIVSAIPSTLVREFEKKDYALQFLAGDLRFGLLQYYRKLEDRRGDESEGRASIKWDLNSHNPNLSNVNYSGTSLNLYYVLCTSDPELKCPSASFGPFRVRIDQPLKLLERICQVWSADVRASGDAFMVPVLYNKDELVSPPPYYLAPPCLVYAQKPSKHSHEAEYRYVVSCRVGTPAEPFLTLKVGRCDDICSPLFR